jgi:hypothetical protein
MLVHYEEILKEMQISVSPDFSVSFVHHLQGTALPLEMMIQMTRLQFNGA